jgi:hypothetical protein
MLGDADVWEQMDDAMMDNILVVQHTTLPAAVDLKQAEFALRMRGCERMLPELTFGHPFPGFISDFVMLVPKQVDRTDFQRLVDWHTFSRETGMNIFNIRPMTRNERRLYINAQWTNKQHHLPFYRRECCHVSIIAFLMCFVVTCIMLRIVAK